MPTPLSPPRPLRLDGHVHLVGDGSEGSGCFYRLPGLWKKVLARIMCRSGGIPMEALSGRLDRLYRETLLAHLDGAIAAGAERGLDGIVLFAQDLPHDADGRPLPEKAGFYVPNDYLFKVCAERPGRILPACSIHPARKDALAELEKCVAAGAKALKLLPATHLADCNDPRQKPFWSAVAQAKLVFICHTGGEQSIPVLRKEWFAPSILRQALECGVTCVAAHGAGRSLLLDADYTAELVRMFDQYPHLYADNSALSSPLRCRTVAHLLKPAAHGRVVHGSDWPIPVGGAGPFVFGQIRWRDLRAAGAIANPLLRDVALKQAMGFAPETFTRMAGLLA